MSIPTVSEKRITKTVTSKMKQSSTYVFGAYFMDRKDYSALKERILAAPNQSLTEGNCTYTMGKMGDREIINREAHYED